MIGSYSVKTRSLTSSTAMEERSLRIQPLFGAPLMNTAGKLLSTSVGRMLR